MNNRLPGCEAITALVRDTSRKLFHADCGEMFLKPLNDVGLGDLSSDICMKLGALLKRDVEGISRELHEELSKSGAGTWSSLHGFLNVRIPDADLAGFECRQAALERAPGSYSVILPAPAGDLWKLSHLRLASIGFLQSIILAGLGHHVKIQCGGCELELRGPEAWVSKYRSLCACSFTKASAPTGLPEIFALLRGSSAERSFVWMPVEKLNHGDLAEYYRTSPDAACKVRFRCPQRGWLSHINPEQPALERIPDWPDDHLRNLLFYLCSEIAGSDLDLYVPALNESANARWYYSTLRQRALRLEDKYRPTVKGGAKCDTSSFSPRERALYLRFRFISTFALLAAYEGDCMDFLSAFADTLSRFSTYMNDPALRIALDSGNVPEGTALIFEASKSLTDGAVFKYLLTPAN